MQKKEVIPNKKANQMGVTLVTLVITIIVLLILAGISLNGIFGESGIINKAQEAKENAEIAEEMELIEQAIIIALAKSKTGAITVEEMQNAINNVTSDNNLIVLDNENTVVVKFNNSNRHYEIDRDGKTSDGPKESINDKYAGDLSKGGKNKGDSDKPYVINCIEDLVVFSRDYAIYERNHVMLARTLDFKSVFSYNDCTSKEYGDLNGDGTEEDIRTELTKRGNTCGGFTPITSFNGTFDGQNNKIRNLYENRGTNDAGLFLSSSGTIKNLGLENITLTGGATVGGILVSSSNATISNCFVEGTSTVTGISYIGLLVGSGTTLIEKCYSKGILNLNTTNTTFGGIVGIQYGGKIKKSYNIMDISSSGAVGGIIGETRGSGVIIEECYHKGNIIIENSKSWASGIACYTTGIDIKNCYNIGEITSRGPGGICSYSGADCFNSYSIGKITSSYCGGIINGMNYGRHLVHCFGREGDFGSLSSYNNNNGYGHGANAKINEKCSIVTDDELKTQDFVDELNLLIEADNNGVITETEQSVWKMDTEGINGGYPIFSWQ